MNEKVILEINNLSKEFNLVSILNDISFKVNTGEIVTIIGPSGAGKSTLLRTIYGLEKPTNGKIIINNEVIVNNGKFVSKKIFKKVLSQCGFIFQDFNLFDNLNVYDNIALALKCVQKKNKEEIKEIINDLITLFGMENKINDYPSTLSGGEKQRIAIIRALALKPQILFLDEPTSSLDVEAITNLVEIIRLLQARNITLLVVTHDLKFAEKISDRIIFLENGRITIDEKTNLIYNNTRINKFCNIN